MDFVGLDIGHDRVKAIGPGGELSFPSLAVVAEEAPTNLGGGYLGDVIDIGTRRYVIGLKPGQVPRARLYGRDFVKSEQWLALAIGALKKLGHEEVAVGVGLPSDDAHDKALCASVRKRLLGEHVAGDWGVTVKHVGVTAQPVGSARAIRETPLGADLADSMVAVLDIGGGTSDLAVVQGDGLFPGGVSVPLAGHALVDAVAGDVQGLLGIPTINRGRVETALRNGMVFSLPGSADKVSLASCFDERAEAIARELAHWVAASVRELPVEALLLTGGGSVMLGKHIEYHVDRCLRCDDPVFANATGFRLLISDAIPSIKKGV